MANYQGAPSSSGGTPKIVPVLVSMGVAIGTFCGLYFGLGTKKDEAAADPTVEVAAAGDGSDTAGSAAGSDTAGSGSAAVEPVAGSGSGSATDPGSGSGSATDPGTGTGSVAAGSGSGSAADPGTGSGSGAVAAGSGSAAVPAGGSGAGSAETMAEPVTLQFSVIPTSAEITMDGKPVEGMTAQVALKDGKKVVTIEAKASGYRSFEKKFTVTGDQVISFKMSKRSGGRGNSGGSGPGDKIDLGKIDM